MSLYVHLPWCIRKCPYCDFNSHQISGETPEADYVAMLLQDLEQELIIAGDRPIKSIFFGGGTPSLFSAASIDDFLSGVRNRADLTDDCEITLEANPGASDQARFAGYREAGVNRLSIGIQSFQNDKLTRLGRIHNRDAAFAAVAAAKQAGFDNFNLDLMYALPEQRLSEALDDLKTAIELQPTHISHYQLTLEPDTAFYRNPPKLPDDDLAFEMQEASQALLASAGYEQYEVSAYAQSGKQCRHNLNYWQFGDYLGIGAGAHGKITIDDPSHKEAIIRRSKRRSPTAWLNPETDCLDQQHSLTEADQLFELLLNGLRLNQGIAWHQLADRVSISRPELETKAEAMIQQGLLESDELGLRATITGRRHLNDLLEAFLPDS